MFNIRICGTFWGSLEIQYDHRWSNLTMLRTTGPDQLYQNQVTMSQHLLTL